MGIDRLKQLEFIVFYLLLASLLPNICANSPSSVSEDATQTTDNEHANLSPEDTEEFIYSEADVGSSSGMSSEDQDFETSDTTTITPPSTTSKYSEIYKEELTSKKLRQTHNGEDEVCVPKEEHKKETLNTYKRLYSTPESSSSSPKPKIMDNSCPVPKSCPLVPTSSLNANTSWFFDILDLMLYIIESIWNLLFFIETFLLETAPTYFTQLQTSRELQLWVAFACSLAVLLGNISLHIHSTH